MMGPVIALAAASALAQFVGSQDGDIGARTSASERGGVVPGRVRQKRGASDPQTPPGDGAPNDLPARDRPLSAIPVLTARREDDFEIRSAKDAIVSLRTGRIVSVVIGWGGLLGWAVRLNASPLIRSFLIAALAMAAPAVAQDAPGPFPDRAELAAAMEAFDVPGAAMALIEDCTVREVIPLGIADLSTGLAVTEQTVFEAASLTKPVFSYILMTMVADGVIDLDAHLAETFAYPRIADAEGYAALTPRMILTHRTGLPNWVDESTPFHERTAPIPFETAPGTAFSYSGEAFQLLQAFLEDASGASLQALFEDRLGAVMPRSTLQQPLPGTVQAAQGYPAEPEAGNGRGLDNLYDRAMAASSLVTTAGDYAAFLAHVCAGGGLPSELQAEMLRPQSPAPMEVIRVGDDPIPPPASWGLGWMILDLGPLSLAGHGGSNDEFTAFAGFMPETGDGLVILTNGRNGERMINAMLLQK